MASAKLSTYRSKRDFTKTGEPSGALPVKTSKQPRFVIQKHAARRLHWDLRLEHDGVFKSWAVTRGPSLNPKDKRLAVETEDHPLDYGDFEGVIPQGEYGGGSVQLWDRGCWKPLGERSVEEQFAKGELKFELDGERLHGAYVMVRMKSDRHGGKRTNWLLIKQRDEHARGDDETDAMIAEDRSVASARSMKQIAAGEGRAPKPFMLDTNKLSRPDAIWNSKGGVGDRLLEAGGGKRAQAAKGPPKKARAKRSARAASAAPPEFIEPALCKLLDRPPEGEGWGHEVKLDGYRLQLRVADGEATLRTRKGLDWTHKFAAIARAAARFSDCIIDGEVVALDENGAPDFAGLQAALSDGRTDALIFYAFDLLFIGGGDLRELPLRERKARLQTFLAEEGQDARSSIRFVEHFETAGDAVLQSACRMNLEGIISKRLDAPYRSGRTGDWAKSKCRAGHEVVIGGWTHERGELRSLLVGVHRGKHLVYVGRVGTGFARDKRARLQPQLKAFASKDNPFTGDNAPRQGKDVRWVKPQLVAEIEFAGWTTAGQIRQAAFKGLREDKPAQEVAAELPTSAREATLAQPTPKRTRAKKTAKHAKTPSTDKHSSAATSAAGGRAVVMGVPISRPDKVLWPAHEDEPAITKLDLARYFETIGAWLIEHIRGRPCSIIRAPDGINGQRFFQRHAGKGASTLLTQVKVFGDYAPYQQIDRIEALAAVAQIAALELHPWNCQPGEPDLPGRLVFDLDPAPELAFDAVVAAALEMKARLEALGLVAFCKTTGGKGLHVVTPLAASKRHKLTWPEAKSFAQTVCAQMAQDSPTRYVINMSKKQRTGRIFLDYLRNDRMATAVAPLSPRLREGAPVSMPIDWSQVKRGLDSMRYTLRTAPGLLAKRAVWSDYCDGERPLEAAARKLVGGKSRSAQRSSRSKRSESTQPSAS